MIKLPLAFLMVIISATSYAITDQEMFFAGSGNEDVTTMCGYVKSWAKRDQSTRKEDKRIPKDFLKPFEVADAETIKDINTVCEKAPDKMTVDEGAALALRIQVIGEDNCREQAEIIKNGKIFPKFQKQDYKDFSDLCFKYAQESAFRAQSFSYIRGEFFKKWELPHRLKGKEDCTSDVGVNNSGPRIGKEVRDVKAVTTPAIQDAVKK